MTTAELIFEGQTFQIARRSSIATRELFVENPNLLSTPYRVDSRASDRRFRLFVAAIEGATTEIGTKNAINVESLSGEFQFLELGRQIREFISQRPHVEVAVLQSTTSDLQKQLAGQNREVCQFAEADGWARAERDSQLEGMRVAIGEVAKKQRHERKKVSELQEAMGKVRRQIEGVMINLSETDEAVEWAALGLAESKDRTSRAESVVAGLRAAMADGSAKVEEVRRKVAGLKAELSGCCPKVNQHLTNLEQELAKLKEEIRTMNPEPELIAPPAVDAAVQLLRRGSHQAVHQTQLPRSRDPPRCKYPRCSTPLRLLTLCTRSQPLQPNRHVCHSGCQRRFRFDLRGRQKCAETAQNRSNTLNSVLKMFYGHSAPMSSSSSSSSSLSSSSSSSRRAQAIHQWAIISGHESEPIPFSPLLLARRSRRYLEELVLGSGPGDIVIDSAFDRDSVVQFISACEGADFSLTLSNVFEIELLCDEWSVFGRSIRQKVIEFIERPPSCQSLWLHRLLFRVGRGLSTSETEDLLRCNLVSLICDSAALDIPAAILSRIIDFRSYEGR
jgi:hypothetical protein